MGDETSVIPAASKAKRVRSEPRFVTRKVVATAQVSLSVLYSAGYFYTLHEFLHGDVAANAAYHDMITSLLSVLTAAQLTIIAFWFQRSRPEDPNHPPGEQK
jgi:hypothetical protein